MILDNTRRYKAFISLDELVTCRWHALSTISLTRTYRTSSPCGVGLTERNQTKRQQNLPEPIMSS